MPAAPADPRARSSQPGCPLRIAVALALLFLVGGPPAPVRAAGDPDPQWIADFALASHGWRANGAIADLRQDSAGVSLRCVGEDPYLVGPVVDVAVPPGTKKLLVELDATASSDLRCYAAAEGGDFVEEQAVQLVSGPKGGFRGVIPALGARMRFRLDPPDGPGPVVLRRLGVLPLVPVSVPPARAAPVPVEFPADALTVSQGAVTVRHDPRRWNALSVSIDGLPMADTDPGEGITARVDGMALSIEPRSGSVESRTLADGFEIVATVREATGSDAAATWRLSRRIGRGVDGVRIDSTVEVDRPREVVHLPWLTLFAGVGTFGTHKTQALLPGVEYLDDEPSSSEKELRGAAANRRLVDPAKVCFPSMVLVADRRWLAVDWEEGTVPASPLFDSPDRVFHSGGHLLGLLSPAAGAFVGEPARFEGEFDVYRGVLLEPGRPVSFAVTLRGGRGETVLDAVAKRVRAEGMPPIPAIGPAGVPDGGLDAACRLLAHGWLDSAARDGTRWRHAVWQGRFTAQPATDVPPFLLWLAAHVSDPSLAARLRAAARETRAALPPGATGGVGHLSRPALPLLLRPDPADDAAVGEALVSAAGTAKRIAAELVARDGRDRYVAAKTDYASTLGADHCNGFTALRAEAMLEAAAMTGDEEAIGAALAALDLVARAHPAGEVPRGAQPWEMPLHTPDILASARLTRCHVLGHLLDGDPARLEQARLWARSGVPFVYLRDPLPGPVGRYATIGVLGATDWVAPVWIGQPVQWCGLVYSGALHDLARAEQAEPGDPAPWRTLARGITRAGLQMTFPVDDPAGRGGLLPDYWLFGSARGDGPAINPGTVQATLAEAFDATPIVTATRLTRGSLAHVLHLPGEVRRTTATDGATTVEVMLWPEGPCRLILTRVDRPPRRVTWNGMPIEARLLPTGCLTATVESPGPVGRAGTLVVEW